MTRVPILTEVVLRAWGTDDPRVVDPLRHENQPGALRRATAVADRARAAGWPDPTTPEQEKAATEAVRRLERQTFRWNNRPAVIHAHTGPRPASDYETDDGLVSIFDE